MIHFFDFQQELKDKAYQSWNEGNRNILLNLATGGGKTTIFSNIAGDFGCVMAIAHRNELVSQMSLTFAATGVKHRIFAPQPIVKNIVQLQISRFGKSFCDPNAWAAVGGVKTVVGEKYKSDYHFNRYRQNVKLWIQDEAHHVLRENEWGKSTELFPNALGLGVTATAGRADKKGLGRHADGLFDDLIVGPSSRDLIRRGFLTDYRLFTPPTDLDMSGVGVGVNGEFVQQETRKRIKNSHLIGDVVKNYLRIAPGKLGITFATDIETATEITQQFNSAGIPAALVHAKTPLIERESLLRQFANRKILMLVNVDLFGEGFDLPAIEVVIMARPTASFPLYVQQFGRALRVFVDPALRARWFSMTDAERLHHIAASSKPYAIIIDHVLNTDTDGRGRHCLPDAPYPWTLNNGKLPKNPRAETMEPEIPVRTCPACSGTHEKLHRSCPYCGHVYVTAGRGDIEKIDGDLTEVDPELLAQLRGNVIDTSTAGLNNYREAQIMKGVSPEYISTHVGHYAAAQAAQIELQHSMAVWAGYHRAMGRGDSEIYKRFYWQFGMDMVTAASLKKKEALNLKSVIDTMVNKG